MSRTLNGRFVRRHMRGVLMASAGKPQARITSLPCFPSLSPSTLFKSSYSVQSATRRHLHLTSFPHLLHSHSYATLAPVLLPPLHSARLSTSPVTLKIWSKVEGEESHSKKKKPFTSPFITLIDTEDKISKIGLDQAEKLAKRRDLKLVKVEDPSLAKGKEVYRLMTGKQYYEEEVRGRKSEKKAALHHADHKDEKSLSIGGNITLHDLEFKLHNITKWLNKGHSVKVTITSKKAAKEDVDKLFSTIEDEVKKHHGHISQRHEKMNDLHFHIIPPKVKEKMHDKQKTHNQQEGDASGEPKIEETK